MDILDTLKDLYKQSTVDRSHYYVGEVIMAAIEEIENLKELVKILVNRKERD